MTKQRFIVVTLFAGCAGLPLTACVSTPASTDAPQPVDAFPLAAASVAQPMQVTFKGTVCTANTNGFENLRRYGLYAGGALTLYCRN